MRYIVILFSFLFLISCGTYRVSTTPKVKITKVLTITSTGDTLAIPIREFQKYNYENIRFNTWNTSPLWYGWGYPYYNYGWDYRFNNLQLWSFSDWYYRPPTWNYSTPIRPEIHPTNGRQRVETNRRRYREETEREVDVFDRVIEKLESRGIRVQTQETPTYNNFSPAPRVRPSVSTPGTPSTNISRTSNTQTQVKGRRHQ